MAMNDATLSSALAARLRDIGRNASISEASTSKQRNETELVLIPCADYLSPITKLMLCPDDDDMVKLCKTNYTLKLIERYLLESHKHEKHRLTEVREDVRKKMRALVRLYSSFVDSAKENLPLEDMFKIQYFLTLEDAIHNVLYHDDGTLKPGYIHFGNLLKTSAEIVKANCQIFNLDDVWTIYIGDFLNVLQLNWFRLFADADYQNARNRQLELERPENYPSEESISQIREYVISKLQSLFESEDREGAAQQFDSREMFEHVRDLVVIRLIIYNSLGDRRPWKLEMSNWNDIKRVDQSNLIYPESEKDGIGYFKVMFQPCEGPTRFISIFVPQECVQGLNYLVDPAVRKISKVNDKNKYLFPHTRYSLGHASGKRSMERVVSAAGVSTKVTPKMVRHRGNILFLYQALEREGRTSDFSSYIGYSGDVDQHIYQRLLGTRETSQSGSSTTNMAAAESCTENPQSTPPTPDTQITPEANMARTRSMTWKEGGDNEAVRAFLRQYDDIFSCFPEEQKLRLVRAKVFTERRKYRRMSR